MFVYLLFIIAVLDHTRGDTDSSFLLYSLGVSTRPRFGCSLNDSSIYLPFFWRLLVIIIPSDLFWLLAGSGDFSLAMLMATPPTASLLGVRLLSGSTVADHAQSQRKPLLQCHSKGALVSLRDSLPQPLGQLAHAIRLRGRCARRAHGCAPLEQLKRKVLMPRHQKSASRPLQHNHTSARAWHGYSRLERCLLAF